MLRNVAHISNLNRQKVPPTLALFSIELTSALKNKYGGLAKGTYFLLRIFNNYVVQPLLTISPSKGYVMKEAMVFTSSNNTRLKCFKEIAS